MSGNDKMSKDSNNDNDGGSGGGVRDERGTMQSNGEDLSGNNKMSKDSGNDNNGSSGGSVRDKRGDNGRTSTISNRSLTLALGDGNTSRGAVTIDGVNGSTALGGSITISLGVGMATSSGI